MNGVRALLCGVLLGCLVVSLQGCGGGGGGGGNVAGNPVPTETAPVITAQPARASADEGQPAMFAVIATSASVMSYQWRRDGQNIGGANAASYRIEQTTVADNGAQFSVVVANAGGSTTSAAAALEVRSAAPVITQQPQAQSVLAGADATFSVVAAGSGTLSFQWRRNHVDIPGATSPSYVIATAALADNGAQYDVVVSNRLGSAISVAAALTVASTTLPPGVVAQPQSATLNVGDTAVFQVTAEGTAPLYYQWQRNGVDIAGAVGASYSVAPVSSLRDDDAYTVRVTNASGSATSAPAVLHVAGNRALDLVAGALGGPGFAEGTGAAARLPYGPTMIDAADNMYVAAGNGGIIKITPQGMVSLWRRPDDGIGPLTVTTLDSNGTFYGQFGASLVKVPQVGSVVAFVGQTSLVAGGFQSGDGVGTGALLGSITYFAADPFGNLYDADFQHTLRKIESDGTVTTIAGTPGVGGQVDGTSSAARFGYLYSVTTDGGGDIYVVDMDQGGYPWPVLVRKVTPAGVVTTLAGGLMGNQNGVGSAASFPAYSRIAASAAGMLYVYAGASELRQVTQGGVVSHVAGDPAISATRDGTLADALFTSVDSVVFDSGGNMLVGDGGTVRKITPGGVVTTLAGLPPQYGMDDGAPLDARFRSPGALAFDRDGNLLVGDTGNHTVRRIALAGPVSTLAGDPARHGAVDGTGAAASFDTPAAIASDSHGNVFVADSAQHVIRKITPAGVVSTFSGVAGADGYADGSGAAARFDTPSGLVVDAADNLYVADRYNHAIRKITPAGDVSLFAGHPSTPGDYDGTGPVARFDEPTGLAIDAGGNVYVADTHNHVVRKITPAATVSTLAGTFGAPGYVDGSAHARFNAPSAVAVDRDGNVYVADTDNRMIRKIAAGGAVSTVAGSTAVDSAAIYGLLPGVRLGNLPGSFSKPVALVLRQSATGKKIFVVDSAENAVLSIVVQ